MATDSSITRRSILGAAAGATAVWAGAASSLQGQVEKKKFIRLGVIGVGRRAHAHLAIMKSLSERCRLTAACDLIPDRAAEAARLAGGADTRTFTQYMELLSAGLCDVVIITTPNYTHKEIAVDALKTGHHVLCEKPLATTLADADAIVEAVAEARKVFAVGLQFRYAPVYLKVRELLKAGTIGDVKYVWAEEFRGDWARLFKNPQENAKKNWRYFQKLSGGTLVEKNCHDLDILSWLIDSKPVRVAATGGNSVYTDRETIDHASVLVDYENGTKLTLGVCLFSKVGRDGTTFIGTDAMLEFSRGGTSITVRRAGRKDEHIDLRDAGGDSSDDRGVKSLYKAFLDAVEGGPPPLTDAKIGRDGLVIPLAAEAAIHDKRIIELDKWTG